MLPLAIVLPWIAFLVYWLVGAFKTNRTSSRESDASRYSVMALLLSGYLLLFRSELGIGPLGRHIAPPTRALFTAGIALLWLGVSLAIWARYHLGQYWSSRVTIKEDHQLIRTGPYARLRHPIYTGLVLMTSGTAVAIDRWRCAAGVALVVIACSIKAKKEEAMLSQQFGDAFQEHRRHAGFLLPRLW